MAKQTQTPVRKVRTPSKRGGGLLLTTQQAAELTGIPAFTLRCDRDRLAIPHLRLGRSLWFPRQQLIEWVARRVTVGSGK
jgi:excisionase family DNA binding protein